MTRKKLKKKYFNGYIGKAKLYSNTKILMIYFSKYPTSIFEEKYSYIKSAAVHPGGVDTEFSRFANNNKFLNFLSIILFPFLKYLLKTPKDGALCRTSLLYLRRRKRYARPYIFALNRRKQSRRYIVLQG